MSHKKGTISLRLNDERLLKWFEERLAQTKLTQSDYVRSLICNDVGYDEESKYTPKISEEPISEIAEVFIPARSPVLSSKLESSDQKKILMRLLDALADFVEDNGEEVVELMEKYQYTLEMHFHKPVAFKGLPKRSKTGYSISAHTDAKKVAEDPPEK